MTLQLLTLLLTPTSEGVGAGLHGFQGNCAGGEASGIDPLCFFVHSLCFVRGRAVPVEVGTGEGPGQVKGLVELEQTHSALSGCAMGVPVYLGRRGLKGGASGRAWPR